MSSSRFSRPTSRIALSLALLALPLATAWNAVVTERAPSLVFTVGPKLGGVTIQTPLVWSWQALIDGQLQKAVTERVMSAFPLRPILVRVNNEIRQNLFGQLTAPGVIQGKDGQLIEESYLKEYCARTEGLGAARAQAIIPKLREIQDYYRSRGAVFVYLVTPSKAAHLPEAFVGSMSCPSTQEARTELVPTYVRLLREAGIAVTDTASLIHGLKGKYNVDLFPVGGVHWNELGRAEAALALVNDINRQAGKQLVPPFTFTYTVSNAARGSDRELVDVVNLLFPALAYPVPVTTLQPSEPCNQSSAASLDVVAVGSSFLHAPAEVLIPAACLSRLNVYFYMKLSRHGGVPYRVLKRDLSDSDYEPIRTAKVVILEENESFLGSAGYVDDLKDLLAQPPR